MENLIVVLSGPSGAGKGSVFEGIKKRRNNVKKEISVTTRKMRDGEKNGIDYIFKSKEEFFKMKEQEMFIETINFDNNYYGTLKPNNTLKSKVDIFYDKNPEGALKIKELYPEAILFYIIPLNVEQLIKQRGNRGDNRHRIAMSEIELAKKMDWLIINDDLEETINRVESILDITRANRMCNKSSAIFLDEFYK